MYLRSFFLPLAFFALVHAQDDIISRCRDLGFNEFAEALENNPDFVARINERSDTTVHVVSDKVIHHRFGNHTKLHKRQDSTALSAQAAHEPPGPAAKKRQSLTASNARTLYQYLENPAFVNLGKNQPGRLVQSFVGSNSPDEATLQFASGLGATTGQLSGPFKFDKGVILEVGDFFTLPSAFSTSIQNDGRADQFYAAVVSAGLESFFDSTTACTVFAPIDGKKYHSKIDVKKHIICGFLGHSPQLLPGTTYYSIAGTPIKVTWGSDGLKRVNGIKFVQTDNITKNGVLHLIEKPF